MEDNKDKPEPKGPIVLSLKPGSLGVEVDWGSGTIVRVHDGQCKRLGVQKGWRIASVNTGDGDRKYKKKRLITAVKGENPYKVTFQLKPPKKRRNPRRRKRIRT